MNMVAGLVLIAVTVAMIYLARPSDGVSAPFLRVWVVGQMYLMTALVSAVIGVSLLISNWPLWHSG
jgi:hypothetical protein